MKRFNLKIQLVYRIVWALIAFLATQCTFTDHLLSRGGDGRPVMLFYTTWSVWLAALVALTSLVSTSNQLGKGIRQGYNRIVPLLKFCATIMIIATFVVSAFVLPDKIWTASYWKYGSFMKHFLLPLVTVGDEILFHPKRHYRAVYPLFGGLAPLVYWVVLIIRNVMARRAMGGSIPQELWDSYYPYAFTNFDNGHTLVGLCLLLLGIFAGLILIGLLFWLCDKLVRKDGRTSFMGGVEESTMTDVFHRYAVQKSASQGGR